MPYQNLSDGLYLMKQRSRQKPGLDHYGVLDIGNRLGLVLRHQGVPIVVHQTPPQVQVSPLTITGEWEVLGMVIDEQQALARLRLALRDPAYDLFGHNCEQFARFVATGARESIQLQRAAGVVGLAAFAFAVARSAA